MICYQPVVRKFQVCLRNTQKLRYCFFSIRLPSFLLHVHVKYDGIINVLDVAKIEEMKWLDGMIDATSVDNSMSWSKYHSIASRREFETPGINYILPLIKEPVHTQKARYHFMNIIKTTMSNINPSQIPADTCDQPVYAITKFSGDILLNSLMISTLQYWMACI